MLACTTNTHNLSKLQLNEYKKSNKVRTKLLLVSNNDNYKSLNSTFTKINSKTLKEFQNSFKNETVNLGQQYFNGSCTNYDNQSHLKQQNQFLIQKNNYSQKSLKLPFSPNSRKQNLSSKKIKYFNTNTINKSASKDTYDDNNTLPKTYTNKKQLNNNKKHSEFIISEFTIEEKEEQANVSKLKNASDSYSYLLYLCSTLKGKHYRNKRYENNIKDILPQQRSSKSQDKKTIRKLQMVSANNNEDDNNKTFKRKSCEKIKINYNNLEEIILKEVKLFGKTKEQKKVEKKVSDKFKDLRIEIENFSNSEERTPISAIKIELNFQNCNKDTNKDNNNNYSNNLSVLSRYNSIELEEYSNNNSNNISFNNSNSKRSSLIYVSSFLDNNSVNQNNNSSNKGSRLPTFNSFRRNSLWDITPKSKFKIDLKTCRKYTERDLVAITPERSLASSLDNSSI